MALRLLRWLGERPSQAPDGPDGPDGLAGLAACYAAQGAWADRARHFLAAGDGHPDLQSSYVALLRRLREVREEENRAFARALAGWTEAGAAGAGVLPIERLLDEVVVPLARSHRVLLVVLDGASRAVACELYEDLLARGWVRRRPADRPLRGPGPGRDEAGPRHRIDRGLDGALPCRPGPQGGASGPGGADLDADGGTGA